MSNIYYYITYVCKSKTLSQKILDMMPKSPLATILNYDYGKKYISTSLRKWAKKTLATYTLLGHVFVHTIYFPLNLFSFFASFYKQKENWRFSMVHWDSLFRNMRVNVGLSTMIIIDLGKSLTPLFWKIIDLFKIIENKIWKSIDLFQNHIVGNIKYLEISAPF